MGDLLSNEPQTTTDFKFANFHQTSTTRFYISLHTSNFALLYLYIRSYAFCMSSAASTAPALMIAHILLGTTTRATTGTIYQRTLRITTPAGRHQPAITAWKRHEQPLFPQNQRKGYICGGKGRKRRGHNRLSQGLFLVMARAIREATKESFS